MRNIFVILFTLITLPAFAQSEYSVANFTDSKKSLQNRIVFPKVDGEIHKKFYCLATLTAAGRFKYNRCVEDGDEDGYYVKDTDVFHVAINSAADRSRIKPAIIGGVKRIVQFQYSVEFIKSGEEKLIKVSPNYGLNVEQYGDDYSAAQHYADANWVEWPSHCRDGIIVWVEGEINPEGRVTRAEVVQGKASDQCMDRILRDFKQKLFLPATSNNQAVSSVHKEPYIKRGDLFSGTDRRQTERMDDLWDNLRESRPPR